MDFDLPQTIVDKLAELDAFIEAEIKPLEKENIKFFDHRREYARTNWEEDGRPSDEWRALISQMEELADQAGHLRYCLPESCGGQGAGNLMNAAIREHLAAKGLGLHNDLQDESSIVGNFPIVPAIARYGTEEQKVYIDGIITGKRHLSFALTEPNHGSDATWLETRAVRDGDHWIINGRKRWNSQVGRAEANLVFARTSGKDGEAKGITAFIVPTSTPGHTIVMNHWTFNMPTDHSEVELKDVRVPNSAILHKEGEGLKIAMMFIHENRIRQSAASAGAARFCIEQAVKYARERVIFGEPLATRQAIQFPLAELHADCEMIRNYIFRTAWKMDRQDPAQFSNEVSICNYKANDLVCRAADFAMQVHGGLGYSRHMPFEHIYRHHRRYRITEGSEEVQKRRIAHTLFKFSGREQ
ncbi:acyl-CoA dehydrogenase family protein [Mesorhizobium australicum]|uniref:Acyl-CoA dehydrogenase n=1 Tax=Mesorhizobium australicum TaxID=536018 RepID=A0A1X7PTJ8_9HYPH|nr:acyl-CoA dehydrogenase family protein [Mesorhizobium australicum]SMH54553.1 Acyl-CoA dehydrogenase [Mesorhizobium australicum]